MKAPSDLGLSVKELLKVADVRTFFFNFVTPAAPCIQQLGSTLA